MIDINAELLKRLSEITDEEKRLLSGEKLDLFTYSERGAGLVDSKKLLEAGRLIDIRPNTRFTAFPRHCHNYVEMVYMCTGRQKHIINGATEIILKKGELLLLNQHAYHETGFTGKDDIAVNFIVLPAFFDTVLELIGPDNLLSEFIVAGLAGGGHEISYMHFDVADILPVQNLLENLIWSISGRKAGRRNINQVTMALLFLNLLSFTDRLIGGDTQSSADKITVSALREIEENYRSASLSAVAQEHNVTAAYVSRTVKQTTGKTFKQLLMDKRLSKAAAMLKNTSLPISDIIAAVGYENASYFYRIFTEKYGMTPKSVRQVK